MPFAMQHTNRRRRRGRFSQQEKPNGHYNANSSSLPSNGNGSGSGNGYYDDSDDDNKRLRRDKDRIFQGSCSFGQFVLNPCLCLWNTSASWTKGWRRLWKRKTETYSVHERRNIALLLSLVVLVKLAILYAIFRAGIPSLLGLLLVPPSGQRPLLDEAFPITISKFGSSSGGEQGDLGGWSSNVQRFFYPTDSLDVFENGTDTKRDFGGLEMYAPAVRVDNDKGQDSSLVDRELISPARKIHPRDELFASTFWEEMTKNDTHVTKYYSTQEDLEDRKMQCRAPSFVRKYHPNCNLMHELALSVLYDEERAKRPGYDVPNDSWWISDGSFRDVWAILQHFPGNVDSILKMTRYKHSFDEDTYRNVLMDANVMELMTPSPRIVDMYGHCGASVWVESLPNEMQENIVDGEGMIDPEDLPEELTSYNNFTVEEKLDIALTMAEGIADLHGFRDGVIVHDDIQLCQWLKTKDGRLKFGDFNRAEAMEWDGKEEEYCKYYNGGCWGNYRAPEEYAKKYVDEKMDIFSFGNNIFTLLTGLWNFYDTDDDETVQEKVIAGERAFVDPRWKQRSFIESELVDLMQKCWIQDVNERIDIFEAVIELRRIKEEHEKMKAGKAIGSK